MFAEGGIQPYERTRRLLRGDRHRSCGGCPNRVRVSGHTAVTRPGAVTVEDTWAITSGPRRRRA